MWTCGPAKNYNPYDSEHSQEAAEGLILDGPDFCSVNSTWTGKLVNQEATPCRSKFVSSPVMKVVTNTK